VRRFLVEGSLLTSADTLLPSLCFYACAVCFLVYASLHQQGGDGSIGRDISDRRAASPRSRDRIDSLVASSLYQGAWAKLVAKSIIRSIIIIVIDVAQDNCTYFCRVFGHILTPRRRADSLAVLSEVYDIRIGIPADPRCGDPSPHTRHHIITPDPYARS